MTGSVCATKLETILKEQRQFNAPRLSALPHLPRPIRPAVGSGAHSAPAWVGGLLANAMRVRRSWSWRLGAGSASSSVLTDKYLQEKTKVYKGSSAMPQST